MRGKDHSPTAKAVRKIVWVVGGQIQIESSLEEGLQPHSVFVISLQLCPSLAVEHRLLLVLRFPLEWNTR